MVSFLSFFENQWPKTLILKLWTHFPFHDPASLNHSCLYNSLAKSFQHLSIVMYTNPILKEHTIGNTMFKHHNVIRSCCKWRTRAFVGSLKTDVAICHWDQMHESFICTINIMKSQWHISASIFYDPTNARIIHLHHGHYDVNLNVVFHIVCSLRIGLVWQCWEVWRI